MKANNKIVVYGNYMTSKSGYGGQITKTRNVFECLKNKYGERRIVKFNMENWKLRPISTTIKIYRTFCKFKNIVILPGDKNLIFLLAIFKIIFWRHKPNVFYMVVGGWLHNYLSDKPNKIKTVSKFKGIFVESHQLLENLNNLGLANVYYSPVFSMRVPRKVEDIKNDINKIKNIKNYKFCTFSRVIKEKGIEDASDAIKIINETLGIKCTLDIYGKIDEKYRNEFNSLLSKNKFIHYCGFIEDYSVINTLSNYHALLFPTYYYGEGFPATLLEANMAGVPIIASQWKYNNEIVKDNITGFLFEVRNVDDLVTKIKHFINNEFCFNKMRQNAYEWSMNFTPDIALKPLYKLLDKTYNEK